MTPRDLIAAFEALAEAPRGIQRLRELVLELAVRGKLVPQDPADEPASLLLERRQLDISEEEAPFDLPHGWAWTCLRLLGELFGGGTPSKSSSQYWYGNIPWVSPKDMKVDWLEDTRDHISKQALEESSVKLVPKGAVLMVVRGMILAHSFPVASNLVEVTVNQDMKALVPFRSEMTSFLLLLLKGTRNRILGLVERSTHGTCKMPFQSLSSLPMALPPLAEQRRIVGRVDGLMSLLDRLEAARDAREASRAALRDAALAALRDAADADDVQAAWARVAERMDDLFTAPADVAPLRQTILQLAVRGRLVPQNPRDEPASKLLERIAAEKARLVKQGKIKKPKPLSSVSLDDAPFDVPNGWAWCRIDQLCTYIVDCLHRTPVYTETGYPAIRTCDVEPGRVLVDQALRVSAETYAEQTRRLEPLPDDVLYSREGGRFGIAAVVPKNVKLCLSQRMMQFRCATNIDSQYFCLFLNSPLGFDQAVDDVGGSASPHVNIASIRRFFFPLPPCSEQSRIVAKVDALMALCDDLEARLGASQEAQAAFAAAAVHHLDT